MKGSFAAVQQALDIVKPCATCGNMTKVRGRKGKAKQRTRRQQKKKKLPGCRARGAAGWRPELSSASPGCCHPASCRTGRPSPPAPPPKDPSYSICSMVDYAGHWTQQLSKKRPSEGCTHAVQLKGTQWRDSKECSGPDGVDNADHSRKAAVWLPPPRTKGPPTGDPGGLFWGTPEIVVFLKSCGFPLGKRCNNFQKRA